MERLPVELFCEVLSLASSAAPSDSTVEVVRLWKMRNVAAAVSRSWRAILYGCPMFWQTIWVYRCTPAPFLSFNLERAGSAAVTLVLDLQPKYSLDLEEGVRRVVCARLQPFLHMLDIVLRPDFQKVARLRVFAADGQEWAAFEQRLSTYAGPRLTTLHVCCARSHYDRSPPAGVPAWGPRLESVAAAGLWFRQPAATFAALTSLEIGWIWNPAIFPWSTFCDVLNGAQQLRQLRLSGVECVDVDRLRVATLPALQRIWMSVDSDACGVVLAQLRAPHLRFADLAVNGEASLAAITQNVDHLLRAASDVSASFFLPLDDGFDQFIGALRNVVILDVRRVGGISGYHEESEYEHGGRVVPHLLRLFANGRSLLPRLATLKVDASASPWEMQALFEAARFGALDTVLCDRDSTRWRLSEGTAVAEHFEEIGGRATGGIYIA